MVSLLLKYVLIHRAIPSQILKTPEEILQALLADDDDDDDLSELMEVDDDEEEEDQMQVDDGMQQDSVDDNSNANENPLDLPDYVSDPEEENDCSRFSAEMKRKVLTRNRLVNCIEAALDEKNYTKLDLPLATKTFKANLDKKSYIEWTNKAVNTPGRQPSRQVILGRPGVTNYTKNAKTEIAAWDLLISSDILESICVDTNRKIEKFIQEQGELHSKYGWFIRLTTVLEIRAFIGLMYARGLLSLNMYDLEYLFGDKIGHPIFGSVMSQKRFEFLKRMICFDNFENREERWKMDRFAAFRKVFELFNNNCGKSLTPEDFLSLDETLYPTRVQIGFRQYNPNKPAKYGLLFRLINCARYPFTHFSMVYSGKPIGQATNYYVSGMDETVKYLVNGLQKLKSLKGRNISTDRLYTSIPLAKWLLSCDVTTVGTLKGNRVGIPKEIKTIVGRENYSSEFYWETKEGKLVLGSYVCKTSKGLKNVLLLTSMPPLMAVTKDDNKKKPAIYKLYDFTKGGTDVVDQLIGVYSTKTKSRKWTWNAFCYVLDTARVNSSTIFALVGKKDPRKQNSLDFGWNLVMQLTKPFITQRNIHPLGSSIKNKIGIILGTKKAAGHQEMQYPSKGTTRRRCTSCIQDVKNTKSSKYSKEFAGLPTSDRQCQRCGNPCCKSHSYLHCEDCK